MKKKIMLVVAIGISFGPNVLGAGPMGSPVTHSGEMPFGKINPLSIACNHSLDKKVPVQETESSEEIRLHAGSAK